MNLMISRVVSGFSPAIFSLRREKKKEKRMNAKHCLKNPYREKEASSFFLREVSSHKCTSTDEEAVDRLSLRASRNLYSTIDKRYNTSSQDTALAM